MAQTPLEIAANIGLTFDDVLLVPQASEIMPGEANVSTIVTKTVKLNIPILSSAMDTVTDGNLAIAMAQSGGIGVVHRNLDPVEQAREVERVKKFESGMVVNPVTISPNETLADALTLMEMHRISGIPVVEPDSRAKSGGRLVGILTNRDLRFHRDLETEIRKVMTKENLITVREGTDLDTAKDLLHQHRIEKLLVVDDDFRCIGLITVKDIEKAQRFPNACKDEKGRLRVAAATGVGKDADARTEALVNAEVRPEGSTTPLDVGALHGRAISLDQRGKVLSYKMTSQCASGSGQFLENIARYLGIAQDEIGNLSKEADDPEKVSSICAVLAETDVINMVSRGISSSNILKGIHLSMASRLAKLLKSTGAGDGVVMVTGGLAMDTGLVAALREEAEREKLEVDIRTHEDSPYAGAMGAALWGAFRHEKLAALGTLAKAS